MYRPHRHSPPSASVASGAGLALARHWSLFIGLRGGFLIQFLFPYQSLLQSALLQTEPILLCFRNIDGGIF